MWQCVPSPAPSGSASNCQSSHGGLLWQRGAKAVSSQPGIWSQSRLLGDTGEDGKALLRMAHCCVDVMPFSRSRRSSCIASVQDPFATKEEYRDSWFDKFMVDYFAKQMSKQLEGAPAWVHVHCLTLEETNSRDPLHIAWVSMEPACTRVSGVFSRHRDHSLRNSHLQALEKPKRTRPSCKVPYNRRLSLILKLTCAFQASHIAPATRGLWICQRRS